MRTTARRLFPIPDLQHAVVVFRLARAARARWRLESQDHKRLWTTVHTSLFFLHHSVTVLSSDELKNAVSGSEKNN